VVRRDYSVELASHSADENGVGGERSFDSGRHGRGREKLVILGSEPSAVSRVRIQRAKSNARLGDAEPLLQSFTSQTRGFNYRIGAQLLDYAAQRNVRRRQHHAKLVGCEHHRYSRSGEAAEHFSVSGEIVAAGVERRLVDRSGHDSIHYSRNGHLHRALDCETAQLSRERCARLRPPAFHRLIDGNPGGLGPYHQNVTALADPWVGERF